MGLSNDKKRYRKKLACAAAVAWLTPGACTLLLLFACSAPVVAETITQAYGKWQILPTPSAEGESLTLSLKAEKAVKGWMKTSVPILTIQCKKGSAAIYVETGMALEVTVVDQQIVHLQIDGNKPFTQRWREVTNATISARDATPLIKQLAQSQKLTFEFTPFSSSPIQTEFAVAGLSAYLPQLAKACW
ncbi:MAG: type VI secretion system-associated protein TagO [Methylovulum sp.]|nr:type VI secretion system-associated protein TagO [Methylovulum sp.]